MPLPLIPIILGGAAVTAGAALHAWLTESSDPWDDKDVFNNRMREMQGLAQALNDGFSACKPFYADKAQVTSWRSTRDSFSKFYGATGTLNYMGPSGAQIAQAKTYASKFWFWSAEYDRLKCGGKVTPNGNTDPYAPDHPPDEPTDWLTIVKWGGGGLLTLAAFKLLSDLIGPRRW